MTSDTTMTRRGFFKMAGLATATIAIPSSLWACGGEVQFANPDAANYTSEAPRNEAWEDLAEMHEQELYTAEDPGPWADKIDVHVPMITLNEGEGTVTVSVMHGMSQEHWIPTIYVRDQDGIVVGLVELDGDAPEATGTFTLPRGTTRVTAYAYCNLHAHWTAESMRV